MPKKRKAKIRKKKSKASKPARRRKVLVGKVKKHTKKRNKAVTKKRKIKIFRKKKRSAPKNKKRTIARRKVKTRRITRKRISKTKKIISHKRKKQVVKQEATGFPAHSLFKAKIKVVGVGGGGGSIVSEIGRSLKKATFVIADTDVRALKRKSGIKYFCFGQELTHGLGTGVNIDLAKQSAESARDKISGYFKGQDIIIFIASLGGGLGSGATQVFAEAAREFGGITFGIFTMPFKFEGKNKQRIAKNALKSLRNSLNVSLVIPNEKIFKIIDANTPIVNAFSTVNKSLIESLESLIDLIYNPGIINIDFADLRTILRGRGNSAFLNTVEESGKNRVEKICEKVLVNPLLQGNNFRAEKILFNIEGAENLSMFEVEKISSHIANLNPKAKIIFGISKNSKLGNRIKTTILMTGGQIKDDAPFKKIEPARAVVVKKAKKIEKNGIKKGAIKPKITKAQKVKSKKSNPQGKKERGQVTFIPVFEAPTPSGIPVLDQKRIDIAPVSTVSSKKTIRRSGLEIKKAEELQEKKKIAQEKEWEIPAFLRFRKNKA